MRSTTFYVTIAALLLSFGCGETATEQAPNEVVINEVAAAGMGSDWFELRNLGGSAIDLAGYTFTDDISGRSNVASFPDGATVGPGRYLVVQFDQDWPGFGLKGDEELAVINPDGDIVDTVDWEEGQSPQGGSFARSPDGTGPFQTTSPATPGGPNP